MEEISHKLVCTIGSLYAAFVVVRQLMAWKCHQSKIQILDVNQGSGTFGFVFDLDGVIYRSRPGGYKDRVGKSLDALRLLRDHGIPYAFVTNSTGCVEASKAAMLRQLLPGITVSEKQVFMATTPMRKLVDTYQGKRVLVTGNGTEGEIARAFGFDDFISLPEFVARRPQLLPERNLGVPTGKSPQRPVVAVLVMSEPCDWKASLQVLLDVLRSSGEPVPTSGNASIDSPQQQVDLWFSNPDFSYPASHAIPRLTQGAFRCCLELLFHSSTGQRLRYKCCGKPEAPVFQSAARALRAQQPEGEVLETIYMVGDNPRSDIRGANAMGLPWQSVLVRTGQFGSGVPASGAVLANDAIDPAHHVVADAFAAVHLALKRHGVI